MSDESSAIAAKLDTLIRLVALGLCDQKSQQEKIMLLAEAGMPPKIIAEIIGTTANTVSVSLSALRKKKTFRRAKLG